LTIKHHLPFDRLTALSIAEGLRYAHPSSLRRTGMHASLLGISQALHLMLLVNGVTPKAFSFGRRTKS